jgi:hypothetical protein
MKHSILLACFALAAAVAAPALAQETPVQRAASFDKADANKDGKLTKAEWVASIPQNARAHVEDAWKRMDPDNKGFMTKDAYVTFNGIPHGVGTVLPTPHN